MSMIKVKDWSKTIILIQAVILLLALCSYKMWKGNNRVITWDVTNYYSYLPATFIYKDPLLSFTKENPEKYYDKFVPLTTPTGGKCIKMSMGLSMLYAPFFFAAHAYAKIFGYPADGYSEPYRFALIISSMIFNILGLIFLRKLLLRFFNLRVTTLTLLAIGLGTNLLYYTAVRSAMSHSYNFALITFFILLTIRWYRKTEIVNSVLIGLLAGLIVLIRPTNIVVVLLFLLWGIKSFREIPIRLKLFLKNYYLIIIILLCSLFLWIPQMLYWKAVSGKYLYFSYQGESFFFNHPQLIKGWFSYRNGWLVYTPVMIFSLLGFYFLFKKYKELFFPFLLTFLVFDYLILSWWCWWYVGFGNRAFIDMYGLLAVPLAAFIDFILKQKNVIKTGFYMVFTFLILLNLFQSWQYKKGYIQFDSMTKEAYWCVFGKIDPKDRFWRKLRYPDYEKALKGIYEDRKNNQK